MARLPRIDIVGMAGPLVQRGNNRQELFSGNVECEDANRIRNAASKTRKSRSAYVSSNTIDRKRVPDPDYSDY